MDKLNNLMQNEYEAMASMDIPMLDKFKEALELIRTRVTKEEFMDIESAIYEGCAQSEYIAFEQGFMRGIVVMKGGAA